jgi:hypothetical protein
MFSEMVMMEKKDACYYKVKASAKVWPSAYASGRLVQCRKKGAANYGNKSESMEEGGGAQQAAIAIAKRESGKYSKQDGHRLREAEKGCPPATQDITLNLKNRQKAIDDYGYGPLNPDLPNTKFWMAKVDEWNLDSVEEAQQSLCGNCAAFDQRKDTLDCIAQGIGSDAGEADPTIEAGDLGYCRFLKFKCAARRTCDAWVTGGPLVDKSDVAEGSEEITWIKPNFDYEWDEIEFQADAPQVPADVRNYMARHFPDKQAWMKSVQHGRPVVLRPDHGQKIRNYPDNKRDLLNALSPQSHDPQGPAKKKRVNALFDKGGPIEMPIILQTEKGLWLIGGKTRLGTANLLKGIPAKVWVIGGEQTVAEDQLNEKWSQKYKSSINCSHPKGFSQKAHCAGKKKHNESVEMEMVCEDCGMCETHQDHENLDEACWKGYHKEGMKELFGKRVPNCVKNEDKEMNMDELSRILELGTGLSMQARAELHEEFDLIESIIETIAQHNGVDSDVIWEDLDSLTEDELYVFAVTSQPIMESEAWQKANNRDKTDGMSRKAVNTYRREHPGSKLQTAVTTKPSKLKKGSKASKRRKSYCSRSRGQMKMHSISCAKTPDKAICKARRRWNC